MRILVSVAFAFALNAAGQSVPPAHPFFDGDAVHEIRLYFEAPDWYEQLRHNFEGVADPGYLQARLVWGEVDFAQVGVRFKGNSSYRTYPTDKKSFKIKTNEYVKGQRIEGLDKINLNNAFKDPAMVREKVYYELARDAGLTASRVNYASVYVNDEYWGLYFLTEDVDGQFLENHVGLKEKGNLYKGDPSGTLQWRGPDPDPYKQMFEKDNNESADDWQDLIELSNILNNTPREQLRERLEPILDVDSVLALLAIDVLTANLDSYIGSGHNYYLYHRQSDGRFQVMPWDPNEAWGVFNLGMPVEELQKLSLFYLPRPIQMPGGPPLPPNAMVPRPLAQQLWEVPEYRERYQQKVQALLDGSGSPDALLDRMNNLRVLIQPFVESETRSMFTFDQWQRAMSEDIRTGGGGPPPGPGVMGPPPAQAIPGLEPFIRARAASVREQLP